MTISILLLTIIFVEAIAIDSDRVALAPLHAAVHNRVAEPSGASPFHIGKVHSARPVFFRPRSPDALLKRLTAHDMPNVPSAFSSANLLQKRHPGVHLTSLPDKTSHPQAKPGQEESNIRKAPEWVEHLPTHSKHKFIIMNLGQSKEVIKQFYGGANGGKPYAIPTTKDVTQKSKRSDLDNEEANKIAEKIIKQELNRAKVAKFGKSAGNAYEGNESGPDMKGEGEAAAPSVEQSGYTTEVKAVEAEWSVNNNKVDEVLSGYSESTSVGEAAALSPQNPSSSASSGPQVIPYALSKSVDGDVTGHGKNYCPPCAERLHTSSPSTVASLAITAPTPPEADTSHSDSAAAPFPVMEGGSQSEPLPPSSPVEVAPAVMPSSDKHEYSQEPPPVHVTVPTSAPQTVPPAPSPNIPPEPIAPEISTSNEQGVSSYKEEIAPAPVEPLPQPESGPATLLLPQTESSTAPPLQPAPSPNSVATGERDVHSSQPLPEPSPHTSATSVEPSPTQLQEKSSGRNYAVEAGASAPLQPSVHYTTTTQSYLSSAPSQLLVSEERPVVNAHTASQVLPTAFSSSYSAASNVPEGGNSIGSGASVSENSYSDKNEETPASAASFSQILPAEAKSSESPASVAVLTTTQQAFVQQPDISLGESSYSNLEEDHTEIQAPPIPAPAPASTYIEEKSSHQFMQIPGLSVHPPNQQTHTELLPELPAGEATVSPQPELRPEAIIIPSTSTTPTLKTSDSDGSPHYINVSPSHGSDHSSSSSSQQIPYVPETAPAITEESEPEDLAPSNAEQSSYNDIEEDHEQSHGPPTIIDPGNTRNIPQVNEEVEEVAKPAYNSQPKTAYHSQPKVAYNTQPKIQVNPAAYEVVRPYAPRPYQPRPVPQQPVLPPAPAPLPVFPQPVPPPAQPFPVYPIPQSPNPYPVSAPSYPVPQRPQGCCGGQLISPQGQLCMPINLDPCGGSRPQQYQRTDGGCGLAFSWFENSLHLTVYIFAFQELAQQLVSPHVRPPPRSDVAAATVARSE
ncbi:unnamed protein product [Haemonchus placei]|uniref:Flocculation protein FLO11-like n=1 Tax=Haemonchus placei TaxID=6290 RepID=A0A158QLB3_HAEPC|nr:unnamed protein product [Haemonchus placei]